MDTTAQNTENIADAANAGVAENTETTENSENAEIFVTKETLIGELLQIDSGVGYILMGIGMHCFGCPASQMESIEEAAMVHGVDADALCDEINDYIRTHRKVQAEQAG